MKKRNAILCLLISLPLIAAQAPRELEQTAVEVSSIVLQAPVIAAEQVERVELDVDYGEGTMGDITAEILGNLEHSQEIAHKITVLTDERAAAILRQEPILKISGGIFSHIDKERSSAVWRQIQLLDEAELPREQWDSDLLTTKEHWQRATVAHFRHWLRYKSGELCASRAEPSSSSVRSTSPLLPCEFIDDGNVNTLFLAFIGNTYWEKQCYCGRMFEKLSLTTIPPATGQLIHLKELCLIETKSPLLSEGIFDQLTQLRSLIMKGSGLVFLQSGFLNHLTQLHHLDLSDSKSLTTLQTGVFRGLVHLSGLNLSNCALIGLPCGVFDGLIKLWDLNLAGNSLKRLPDSVFDGLTQLRNLELIGNPLVKLPLGIFDHLTELFSISLSFGHMVMFPPSLLKLRNLTHINLGSIRSLDSALEHQAQAWTVRGIYFTDGLRLRRGLDMMSMGCTMLVGGAMCEMRIAPSFLASPGEYPSYLDNHDAWASVAEILSYESPILDSDILCQLLVQSIKGAFGQPGLDRKVKIIVAKSLRFIADYVETTDSLGRRDLAKLGSELLTELHYVKGEDDSEDSDY